MITTIVGQVRTFKVFSLAFIFTGTFIHAHAQIFTIIGSDVTLTFRNRIYTRNMREIDALTANAQESRWNQKSIHDIVGGVTAKELKDSASPAAFLGVGRGIHLFFLSIHKVGKWL